MDISCVPPIGFNGQKIQIRKNTFLDMSGSCTTWMTNDHDAGNHDNDDDNDDNDDDDDQAQSGLKYWNVSAWEPLKESIVSRHRAYCYFTHLASSSSSPSPSFIWWKAAE